MARHSDPDPVHPTRVEHPVQAALVVGVDLVLGLVGSLLPTVDGRLDVLHRQVGPLDQADLDLSAAASGPGVDPGDQFGQRRECIGEIRLKHDAGVEFEKLVLVEHGGEGGQRQLEIVVLLHVQVDEGGRPAGRRRPEDAP